MAHDQTSAICIGNKLIDRKTNQQLVERIGAKGNTHKDSWMIGDRPEDQQCAEVAGVKFVWASVMQAKFAGPGMREIECQHIEPDVLMQFLSI